MASWAIALGDLATGVEWVSQASGYISLGTNRQVYVYLRNADGSQGAEADVYQDAGLTTPLPQPLTAGAATGALPGFVLSGQSLLFVDVASGLSVQADALAASASGGGGGSVTSPDGTISVTSGSEIDVVFGTVANTAAEGDDSRITGALQKSGGTMSGALAMGASKITGLANGTASTDAAAFGQVPTAGASTPSMDGTGSAGSAATWSKSDHVHPSDTSRAPLASPTFTGTTTAPEFSASGLTGATAASRWVGATASGAPTSGTFAVGDFVIDQTGFVWVCTTAGSPGTWTKVGGGGSSAAFAFGTAASRPAAAAGNANTGYFATDTGEVTFSDGTSWHAITHFSSGISTTGIWEQGTGISFDALDNSMTRDNGTGAIRASYTNPGGAAFEVNGGALDIQSVGSGVRVAEGSNAKQGTATLSAGTITVSNTSVTATSRIMLTIQSPGGTVGSPYVYARTAGTSFTIKSTSSSDTSVVAYEIFEVG